MQERERRSLHVVTREITQQKSTVHSDVVRGWHNTTTTLPCDEKGKTHHNDTNVYAHDGRRAGVRWGKGVKHNVHVHDGKREGRTMELMGRGEAHRACA